MLSEETRRKLREMNLGELVKALDFQEKQPEYMALSFDERMNIAVDYTYSAKYNARVHRLINAAKFRIAVYAAQTATSARAFCPPSPVTAQ